MRYGLVLVIAFFAGASTFVLEANADISKQAGRDSCEYMYEGDNDWFPSNHINALNQKACLAPNGTVYCGNWRDKCGKLGVDYKVRSYNGSVTIFHWKQSSNGRVLKGYKCPARMGGSECDDVISTAVFNYISPAEYSKKIEEMRDRQRRAEQERIRQEEESKARQGNRPWWATYEKMR